MYFIVKEIRNWFSFVILSVSMHTEPCGLHTLVDFGCVLPCAEAQFGVYLNCYVRSCVHLFENMDFSSRDWKVVWVRVSGAVLYRSIGCSAQCLCAVTRLACGVVSIDIKKLKQLYFWKLVMYVFTILFVSCGGFFAHMKHRVCACSISCEIKWMP